ncbi:MAG: hypothetical protein IT258_17235, partial [Saprospiraceae bacterium]|nr:hypothetical protein [Saprospiraceae bacterium]
MKSIFPIAVLAIVALSVVLGCVKPPKFPVEPEIEFVQGTLVKDTLFRANPSSKRDTNYFTLSFTDGDGDIGDKATGSRSLIIMDNRDGHMDSLEIPEVSEVGASNGIKGEIFVRMFTTCCIYPAPYDLYNGCTEEVPNFKYNEINYTVFINDRAG